LTRCQEIDKLAAVSCVTATNEVALGILFEAAPADDA
jgi:hypothetical protein